MSRTLDCAVISAFLLGACRSEAPAPGQSSSPKQPTSSAPLELGVRESRESLLSLLQGAVVVERSGELSLESSAIHGIDSDHWTSWTSPPDDLQQWMVVQLRQPARIR